MIAQAKLDQLRALPYDELVSVYGVPPGGRMDPGVDEFDEATGQSYVWHAQALPRQTGVRLLVVVSPRVIPMHWGRGLRWLMPVTRRATVVPEPASRG